LTSLIARLQGALPAAEGPLSRLQLLLTRMGGGGERAQAGRVAITAFLVRVASAVIAYASQVLLARWMGSFDYGVFVSVWVWVVLLGAAATLGFNNSIMRFVAELTQRGEHDLLRGVLFGSRVFSVLVGTLMAGIGGLCIFLLGDLVSSHFAAPIVLALVCLPLYALTEVQDGLARPYGWVDLALAPPYICRPLLILALMTAAYAAGLEATAPNAMAAAVAATWITGLLQLAVLQRRLATRVPRGPRRLELGRWIRVSGPIFASDILRALLLNVDVLVLSVLAPAELVGIYFATAKTLSLIAFVSFATATAATHKFAAYHAAGDRAGLQRLATDSARWTFWPSLAAAAVMLALGRPLLSLFGPDFVAGYPLMAILTLGLLARAAVGPLDQLLNMLGHEAACARIYAVTFSIGLSLHLLLVPAFGLFGAAVSMALAMLVESFLLVAVAGRRTGIDVSIRSTLRGSSVPG